MTCGDYTAYSPHNPERDDLRDNTDKTTEMNPSGSI
jgi:hypothetical protein